MIVKMTRIQDASTKDLDHLHPDGTVSFLLPQLVGLGFETKNGWVQAHFSTSLWHACGKKCSESGPHNVLHCVDAVGYVMRRGKRLYARITNFDAKECHGMMELEQA